jgi:hypothetical protein
MSDPNIANIGTNQLYEIILAIGGLGTAAYGLVDATKSFGEYGPSQVGFSDIRKVISRLFPKGESKTGTSNADALQDLLATLQPNWINGMAMSDQKAIAKALIKLRLTPDTADSMAKATGTNPTTLGSIATKLRPSATPPSGNTAQQGSASLAPSLNPGESDELGRFDLALSALLDQGYQRGDQRYRNFAKILAVVFSVAIAIVTTWLTTGKDDHHVALAVIAGLLATPLAPVAKDLASTIQAGAKLAQFWKK